MAEVELRDLTKRYGATIAVDNVNLRIAEGELVALLGPSGCGKTTTLRMIAGFVEADEGEIRIGGRDVTDLPPYRRDTGMVFQGYALFPHLTVAQNVAFGLEMRKVAKAEIRGRVAEALRLVRLDGFADRLPRQLSGGQQQRVALARALVIKPALFLLDEPLSNLDAKLRQEVRVEIRQLQQRLGLTTVFVTHDQEEALSLADRLVVMHRGAIQQIGTPAELYDRPATLFVADFIGKSNFFYGELAAPHLFVTAGGLRLPIPSPHRGGGTAVLAVRPEKIELAPAPLPNRPVAVEGRIERAAYLGAVTEYVVRCAGGETLVAHGPAGLGEGSAVWASWDPASSVLLPDAEKTPRSIDQKEATNGG